MAAGLRIRDYGVHPDVRISCVRFARWLRREIDFPLRVIVYLHPTETVQTRRGQEVLAAFFAPRNGQRDTFARVAAGSYPLMRRTWGRRQALAYILDSFVHEIVHYEQWRDSRQLSEHGVVNRVRAILDRYRRETGPL